jgi:hypothetical protein
MRLIIQTAEDNGAFPQDTRVRVKYGVRTARVRKPKRVPDVSYWGLESELP